MNLRKLSILSSVILILLPWSTQAIERSCQAFYEIERASATYLSPAPPVVGVTEMSIKLGHFRTTGSCGNKAVANRCRERARNSAHNCMIQHWAVSGSADFPWACTGSSIQNYPISSDNLSQVIRNWVCTTFRVRSMGIRVKAITTGNTGCPKTSWLSEFFTVQCGPQ